ncbi:hypothetical protein EV421DRAFT_1737362 [Armillaria borealis]|uniref:Uncharacterized protein n=1 Tax=Armillaria borealis TaxID=47425 RepID=A0AA39JEH4_9AGAR|nr:hypothetical protein EV421DRAFT_1737362 [Armillaria borealis]
MPLGSHGYTDAKLPYRLGYFFGAKCTEKVLVPMPLLESVRDGTTRSINDLDVRYWMDNTPYISGIQKCDEGRKVVPLPPFMQSLTGVHAYVIYYVSLQRSRWWAGNGLLQKLHAERVVKGDVLVMKLTSPRSIGDMSAADTAEVEELLIR